MSKNDRKLRFTFAQKVYRKQLKYDIIRKPLLERVEVNLLKSAHYY